MEFPLTKVKTCTKHYSKDLKNNFQKEKFTKSFASDSDQEEDLFTQNDLQMRFQWQPMCQYYYCQPKQTKRVDK